VRIAVEQGAVFFFGFDILLLQNRVFDGHTDPTSDQLQDVLLAIGELARPSAADADDTEGLFLFRMDWDISQ